MDATIIADTAGKRGRNSSVILTDRLCEKRVPKRTKLYDRKVCATGSYQKRKAHCR
jgi:hypothetical protein